VLVLINCANPKRPFFGRGKEAPTWPSKIPQIVQKLKTCGAEGLTLRFTLSFKVTL
jgi:hypothetical protein